MKHPNEPGPSLSELAPPRPRPGRTVLPKIEPFVPNPEHNPRDLKSWAKRTGFNLSGETTASSFGGVSGPIDLEKGPGRRDGSVAKVEIEPILGRRREEKRGFDVGSASDSLNGVRREGKLGALGVERERRRVGDELQLGSKDSGLNGGGGNEGSAVGAATNGVGEINKEEEVEMDVYSEPREPESPFFYGKPSMKCGVRENPGYVPLIYYGLQHYLSLAGSIFFIPLIIVPAMGGTDEETAYVISTMLLITGLTTILHSYFGTRLPLVQGSSFVYLAPALVIINSEEFRNLSVNKFRHIMRELQGAVIVGSVFQTFLGYSGLMSILLRFINPVVVAPTVASVGLAFFSYGFPQAGNCVGVTIPQILLVLVFTLYLRRVSIIGHRVFLVYAVPLSVIIVWAYAFFLTEGGAYNYKGCSANIPSSNILTDQCRKHAATMRSCRTDISNALNTAAWVRVPYPFQWGIPTFHFKTYIIMIVASLVASVDSVGSYHATSILVNLNAPTPGIVSRGIGLEGFSSILAGLWGTGTGSTTLTENVHTINITKMASQKALQLGAVLLILFSFIGKVCALLASIPQALAASVLCFIWALTVALGLSTMQYTQTASSRNILIVGFSLFISLSIPAYVQQYSNSSLVLPSYLVPYAAASNGPVNTGSKTLDFALNGLLSLNMVVAMFVAFILDNTVPGSRQERGVYIWSSSSTTTSGEGGFNSPVPSEYYLPRKVGQFFKWAKWVGA
ncbi:Nucleobase-ascorbate transporter 11 [Acorus gramineus]|uniref:Nucleobase-ascorbate transporter 11 n=1 Tax=Acorus gramineus TaxID=55184 RepID=A0AAV9BJF4_ACOGR|nr:Nucleobase-ascorbate transporter 11 [Acorus gramineus]